MSQTISIFPIYIYIYIYIICKKNQNILVWSYQNTFVWNFVLRTHTNSIFTTSCQNLLSTNFTSKNRFYFFFLIFWYAPIPPFCWNSIQLEVELLEQLELEVLICCLYFSFTCFALFISATPSHKYNMNNSFRIMFVKIYFIKANIIKICTNFYKYPFHH